MEPVAVTTYALRNTPLPAPDPRPPRLRRETILYLEAELRDYKRTKHVLTEEEAEITQGGFGLAYDEMSTSRSSSKAYSDPTGVRGTKLAEYTLLRQMRRMVEAIEGVVLLLPQEQKNGLALLYWETNRGGTTKRIADLLHVDERTCRRWRDGWLALLASRLGMR